MIYYSIPFNTNKDIAVYYNDFMKILPSEDDFACFIDGDAMFTTTFYGKQLEEIVALYPDCGLFWAVTNRIGCYWQIAEDVDQKNNDISYHRTFGQLQLEKHQNIANKVVLTGPEPTFGSGFFILTQKKHWLGVGGFRGDGMLKVDNNYHSDSIKHNKESRLMRGVYIYHWYRYGTKNISHLKK